MSSIKKIHSKALPSLLETECAEEAVDNFICTTSLTEEQLLFASTSSLMATVVATVPNLHTDDEPEEIDDGNHIIVILYYICL